MSDELKFSFFEQTTLRTTTKRSTVENSRKEYSFQYYLESGCQKCRVCKRFYLSTLDISQKRISYYHEKIRNHDSGMSRHDRRGKHTKKVTPARDRELVAEHINSFPRVQSHFRRSHSNKEYLEQNLSLQKMYDLYKVWCNEKNVKPVKFNMYRKVFKTDMNIAFSKPKNDRCELCEEYEVAQKNNNVNNSLTEKHKLHVESKRATREERSRDRENKTPVLCFDLQNVISIPRANAGNMFYKRKLSVYNLTGHLSVPKRGYCVVWHESLSGRSGNDIATALVAMLERIVEQNPTITELHLWSDSCVPQNKNSQISLALMHFIQKHSSIKTIVQKFCEPGHSSIGPTGSR